MACFDWLNINGFASIKGGSNLDYIVVLIMIGG